MKYLPSILSRFFSKNQPALRLAILSPASSVTMETYINEVIHQLQLIVKNDIEVVQYPNATDERRFAHFARDATTDGFDIILAITYLPGTQARRLYTEYGVLIPTLIVTYKELLPLPLPRHISGLLIPNNGAFIHRLLTTIYPSMGRILLCGTSKLLNNLPEMIAIQALLKNSGVEITTVHLDQSEKRVIRKTKEALRTHKYLFMTKDVLAFHYMPTIIPLAKKEGCTVIAGEPQALKYGTDLVFGYSEEALAQETAAQLYRLSQHPHQETDVFKIAQEVYCPASTHTKKLSSLFSKKNNVNFKLSGTTGNRRDEKDSPVIRKQSTKQ